MLGSMRRSSGFVVKGSCSGTKGDLVRSLQQRGSPALPGEHPAVGQPPGGRAGLAGSGPGRCRGVAPTSASPSPAYATRRCCYAACGRLPCGGPPRSPLRRQPSPPPPGTISTGWPAVPAGRSPRTGAATASCCVTPSGCRPRRPGAARAAWTRPAAAAAAGPAQRHPAAGPACCADPAAGPRGAASSWSPRRPGLVPGGARADRQQRLPVSRWVADRGPAMAFIRCDRGTASRLITPWPWRCSRVPVPCTRPTSSLTPTNCASAATDVGLGRHIQGSQIFDYLARPRPAHVRALRRRRRVRRAASPAWAPLSVSGLAQRAEGHRRVHRRSRPRRRCGRASRRCATRATRRSALRGLVKAMGS